MGEVIAGMTVSLDGFVNDRNGDVSRLYPDLEALRRTEHLREAIRTTGSVVMGRSAYEMANGDFTDYEFQVPIFVITHEAPRDVARGENEQLRFTFVTDGPGRALERARVAAGDRDVTVVGGASTVQQLLNAGLVDELQIDLMPVLLGEGLRLFEGLATERIGLEQVGATPSAGRLHLRYRVLPAGIPDRSNSGPPPTTG